MFFPGKFMRMCLACCGHSAQGSKKVRATRRLWFRIKIRMASVFFFRVTIGIQICDSSISVFTNFNNPQIEILQLEDSNHESWSTLLNVQSTLGQGALGDPLPANGQPMLFAHRSLGPEVWMTAAEQVRRVDHSPEFVSSEKKGP